MRYALAVLCQQISKELILKSNIGISRRKNGKLRWFWFTGRRPTVTDGTETAVWEWDEGNYNTDGLWDLEDPRRAEDHPDHAGYVEEVFANFRDNFVEYLGWA